MKAKYKRLYIRPYDLHKILVYEYRNHEYDVDASWNAENIGWQHKQSQDYIDRLVETLNKPTTGGKPFDFEEVWNLAFEEYDY